MKQPRLFQNEDLPLFTVPSEPAPHPGFQVVTRVFNLATQQEAIYSLPPKQAVMHAHAQLTVKDQNWWDYDKRNYEVSEGKHSYCCGDWAALKDNR